MYLLSLVILVCVNLTTTVMNHNSQSYSSKRTEILAIRITLRETTYVMSDARSLMFLWRILTHSYKIFTFFLQYWHYENNIWGAIYDIEKGSDW